VVETTIQRILAVLILRSRFGISTMNREYKRSSDLKVAALEIREAGTLAQDEVVAALEHAKIAEGPWGPAAMIPCQHHVRMNMYIAQARSGKFQVIESLGAIDPKEAHVASGV
jgi:hypothetical protein